MDARDVSLNVLLDMESNGTFSNIALAKALRQNQFEDKKDRAFVTRLVEGITEYRLKLDYVINQFSKTKVNKCKPLIRCLLRMGTYQILFMDSVPDSAACNEMVKLAKKHGFTNLSGFVNGVLRSVARAKESQSIKYPDEKNNLEEYLSIQYSMPLWLVQKIMNDFKEQGRQIIEGSFVERKTTLRVNTSKVTKEELKEMLLKNDIEVLNGFYNEKALLIDNYDFIRKVPGYKQGYFTIQDESSMCAIEAAHIKEGDVVVDVCAAPGGKTTGAAEYLNNTGHIYSMDISEDKLSLIEENVARLGFSNIDIDAFDATKKRWDAPIADVVIADLPCSGLGIIGRKNDIKYRVTKEDLDNLVCLQRQILSNVKDYVKLGGTLLFSTCTINPDENMENVKWFLENNKDFELEEHRLFLQGIDSCDGFFYAVMRKK